MNTQTPALPIPVVVEKISDIKRKLTISLPMDDINSKILMELQKTARKVKLPGFRVGKVPFDLVKRNYGDAVREEVTSKEIKRSYFAALEQEHLNPIGLPRIELENNAVTTAVAAEAEATVVNADINNVVTATTLPEHNFVYYAFIEVAPEINLVDLNKLNVEKITATVTEEDINEMLEKMRKEKADWVEIETATGEVVTEGENQPRARTVHKGDKIAMEFYMKLYGDTQDEVVKEEQDENAVFEVGSGEMWSEFEEYLLNKSIGEEVTFNLTFPATHVDKDVAGRNAEFNVKIKKLWEAKLPPLDDEFAAKYGIKEAGGIEALRTDVRNKMEKTLQHIIKENFDSAIVAKLAAAHSFEVPERLIDEEINKRQAHAKHQLSRYLDKQNLSKQKIGDLPRQLFESAARQSVINSLLLARVAEINNLKVDQQQLRAKIEELAVSYPDHTPEEVINWFYSNPEALKEVEMMLLSEVIFDYLKTQVQITEKPISYKEVIELSNKKR